MKSVKQNLELTITLILGIACLITAIIIALSVDSNDNTSKRIELFASASALILSGLYCLYLYYKYRGDNKIPKTASGIFGISTSLFFLASYIVTILLTDSSVDKGSHYLSSAIMTIFLLINIWIYRDSKDKKSTKFDSVIQ